MNKNELVSVMKRCGDTQIALANELGVKQSGISARLNGKTQFKSNEIEKIRKRYGLTNDQTALIFFDDGVSKNDTAKGA